MLKSGTTLK